LTLFFPSDKEDKFDVLGSSKETNFRLYERVLSALDTTESLIYESRIYGVALTQEEIKGLKEGSLSIQPHDKLNYQVVDYQRLLASLEPDYCVSV